MRSDTSAPGRANARVRRSRRCGRSVSATTSWISRNINPRITGTSRTRMSISRSTTVCPRERRSSAVASSAPRTSSDSRPLVPVGKSFTTAIRRRAGGVRAACANSPSCPASTSSIRAVSRTERASDPNTTQCAPSLSCGARGTRSRWGLSPNSPQHAAGIRIEPAPSAASAAGTIPAATAAADPPLEPPGVRSGSHGLRVTPQVTDSVNGHSPSSGIFVLPTTIAPAARSRRTTSASAAAGVTIAPVPRLVISPPISISSLTATGTPMRGRLSPARTRASACAASSSARSA